MKTYTDPVFMPNERNKKDILAAYDPEYFKAMIISDTGIEENSVIKKGQEVSVIYPAASTKEEPTDRSISPVRIIIPIPSAIVPRIAL